MVSETTGSGDSMVLAPGSQPWGCEEARPHGEAIVGALANPSAKALADSQYQPLNTRMG